MPSVTISLYNADGDKIGERRMQPGDRSFVPSHARGMVLEDVEETMGDFAL